METGSAFKVALYRSPGVYKSCIIRGKYSECYKIGERVTARENTLGVFCFKNRGAAEYFIYRNSRNLMNNPNPLSILRVKGIGKGLVPERICCIGGRGGQSNKLNEFYAGKFDPVYGDAVKGTVCYPSIEVLEEVMHDIYN